MVGYGTIGRRIAEAIAVQPDMELVGVVKRTPDYKALIAANRNIDLYALDEASYELFQERGVPCKGVLDDLLENIDMVIDSSPAGMGAKNKAKYENYGLKMVFQGGEDSSVAEVSFVSECSYEKAYGKNAIRVVSCNTTGLSRLIYCLNEAFKVKHVFAVLVRRSADPEETRKGPIDAIVPDIKIPSHHARDVNTVLDVPIVTMAVKVPVTHMHVHALEVKLGSKATREDVIDVLEEASRIILIDVEDGLSSTGRLFDYARLKGRPMGNIYELMVWRDSIKIDGDKLYLFQAVHQEAIVIPDNIDAVRSAMKLGSKGESIRITNATLGITGRAF